MVDHSVYNLFLYVWKFCTLSDQSRAGGIIDQFRSLSWGDIFVKNWGHGIAVSLDGEN
jgi:hypothetical protein